MSAPPPAPPPASTGSSATRVLGAVTLAGIALLVAYSFWWSPADQNQGDLVRLIYLHVPIAIWSFGASALTTISSIMWLWRRSEGWWVLGGAATEVGMVLTALTLVVGAIWGRPTWNTWWTWDPRVTSEALLFILLIGYLALRRVDSEAGDPAQHGTRSAIVGLLLFPNVIVVHFSVDWWRSLHQPATISRLDPVIEGTMLFTLMLGMVVCGLGFAWLMIHRFRLSWLEERIGAQGLDEALAEPHAEAEVGA